jgi:acetyl esterase
MTAVLDQATGMFLAGMRALGGPPFHEQSVEDIRAGISMASQQLAPPRTEVHRAVDRRLPAPTGEVGVRIYTPRPLAAEETLPIVLHFHGGGFIAGSVDTHDAIARHLCAHAEAIVIGVDYRLAPEHPFPAAVDDAYGALSWAAEHAAEIGGDPSRIAVAGDSAGGNLAAVLCQLTRERRGPAIAFQALLYPVVDFDLATPRASMAQFGGGDFFLSVHDMEMFRSHYFTDVAGQMRDPHASPLVAEDLSGLPPALILTSECDPLRDEGKAYADRLAAAGVPVQYHCVEGTIHAFMSFGAAIPAGVEALAFVAGRLRAALHQGE